MAAALRENARSFARREYLENDPISLAHSYPAPRDQEIVALIGALLAFGSVRAFLPKIRSLLEVMGESPRRYVAAYKPSKDLLFFKSFRSRIYDGDDLRLLLSHLQLVLKEHATLEDAFLALPAAEGPNRHRDRLVALARLFYRLDPAPLIGLRTYPAAYRHLVTDPAQGSACKRWNLFLRWVIRPADGVDLGLWKRVDTADLVVPLDLHVGRITSLIGLRRRRTPDWKAAEEVTARLRSLDPKDPVRFDFPLSHIGISARCKGRWIPDICGPCKIRSICRVGRRGEGLARRPRGR